MENIETVKFDPGYNKLLVNFMPVYSDCMAQVGSIKNFNQKKITYKMLQPKCERALKSTLGFWVGCILWGIYLSYKYYNLPKEIEGNSLLDIDEDELKTYKFEEEFEIIENFLKNYSKDTKYYLGKENEMPKKYLEIFKDYKDFSKMNDFFINVRMTTDIKIPKKYELEYNDDEIEAIYNKIQKVIESKDLSNFLK